MGNSFISPVYFASSTPPKSSDPSLWMSFRYSEKAGVLIELWLLLLLMLRPSFALDCHYTLHIAIVDS
jgi:hypothetical protein